MAGAGSSVLQSRHRRGARRRAKTVYRYCIEYIHKSTSGVWVCIKHAEYARNWHLSAPSIRRYPPQSESSPLPSSLSLPPLHLPSSLPPPSGVFPSVPSLTLLPLSAPILGWSREGVRKTKGGGGGRTQRGKETRAERKEEGKT